MLFIYLCVFIPRPSQGLEYLEVSVLRLQPVLDEVLRLVAEAQHEVSLRLQLVYRLDGLVNLMNGKQRNVFKHLYLSKSQHADCKIQQNNL